MIDKLIYWGLKRKYMSLVVVASVSAAGIHALFNLPVDAFPDVTPNLVQVFAEIEGMAPEEVEQLVTRPVEIAMRGIPGVHKIRSLSSFGLSTINIYFEDTVPIYRARQLVAERLKLAEDRIPHSVDMPHGLEMGPVASGMGKILSYYLHSENRDITELRTLQDWVVRREIETLPGVAKVISQGGHVKQYNVTLIPEKMLALGLTADDVAQAIELNNENVGGGIITRDSEELIVRSLGRASSLDDIAHIVVASVENIPVLVKDVGEVSLGQAFRRGVALINGDREVVLGGVYKLHKANSFKVIQSLRTRIQEINKFLPEDVQLVIYYDQSELVANSIRTVKNALIMGLVLVSVVAFLSLGNVRNALIMIFSLPFSMFFGFIVMNLSGTPGDLISLGGMAIALGMLIDATIIMVEKIQSSLSDGKGNTPERDLLFSSAREVGRPIVFSVLVIIIVFLPIFTLGEIEGKMFRPLAFTVSATLSGSLFYALLIAPSFYSILHGLDRKKQNKESTRNLDAIKGHYEYLLRKTLKHPRLMLFPLFLILMASILGLLGLGREFIPALQEGTIQCLVTMNPNVSLDEIKGFCAQVAEEIRQVPEVRDVIVDIGYGEVGPHIHHTNYGCITVTLEPGFSYRRDKNQGDIINDIDARLDPFLGASVAFSQPINHELDGLIAGAGSMVVLKVFGDDLDQLQGIAGEIEGVLKRVEGVADLQVEQISGQTQMQVIFDSSSLARYGLNKRDIQNLIRQAITGQVVGHVFEGEMSTRIFLRLDPRYQENEEDLGSLWIHTPVGSHVPLNRVARIETVTGLRQISREDTQRYISILCNVRGRDVGTFVREAQKAVSDSMDLPPGYRLAWGGQFELQQAANRRLAIVIPITLILILCMLFGLFGSFRLALLIMLNIPLSLVGGILALAIFGEHISIPSSIGFIALFGIALTDGVVLISRFESLRKEGIAVLAAVISGCLSKIRPVLMTTVTTALGLLPLILARGTGSEVQRPLAMVVVFGLATSTLVTLFVIPAVYIWIEREKRI